MIAAKPCIYKKKMAAMDEKNGRSYLLAYK